MRLPFYTWKYAKKHRDKGYTKEFFHVHFIWKYRYLLPLLHIGEWILRKQLVRQVPEGEEYHELRLLSVAVEDSIRPWAEWMIKDYNERRSKAPAFKRFMTKPKGEAQIQKRMNSKSARYVILMKDFLVTMAVYDTAYRPLITIILKNYTEWKRKTTP